MKLLTTFKTLVTIDLSGNSIKDDFVPLALDILNKNTQLTTLYLANNQISLRKISAINLQLDYNKNLLMRDKVPKYIKEINTLSSLVSKAPLVSNTMKQISKDCEIEQIEINNNMKIWKNVHKSEDRKSVV